MAPMNNFNKYRAPLKPYNRPSTPATPPGRSDQVRSCLDCGESYRTALTTSLCRRCRSPACNQDVWSDSGTASDLSIGTPPGEDVAVDRLCNRISILDPAAATPPNIPIDLPTPDFPSDLASLPSIGDDLCTKVLSLLPEVDDIPSPELPPRRADAEAEYPSPEFSPIPDATELLSALKSPLPAPLHASIVELLSLPEPAPLAAPARTVRRTFLKAVARRDLKSTTRNASMAKIKSRRLLALKPCGHSNKTCNWKYCATEAIEVRRSSQIAQFDKSRRDEGLERIVNELMSGAVKRDVEEKQKQGQGACDQEVSEIFEVAVEVEEVAEEAGVQESEEKAHFHVEEKQKQGQGACDQEVVSEVSVEVEDLPEEAGVQESEEKAHFHVEDQSPLDPVHEGAQEVYRGDEDTVSSAEEEEPVDGSFDFAITTVDEAMNVDEGSEITEAVEYDVTMFGNSFGCPRVDFKDNTALDVEMVTVASNPPSSVLLSHMDVEITSNPPLLLFVPPSVSTILDNSPFDVAKKTHRVHAEIKAGLASALSDMDEDALDEWREWLQQPDEDIVMMDPQTPSPPPMVIIWRREDMWAARDPPPQI